MTITSGNFQDLVQLSADTLYHLGPDFEVGNSSVGSSATVGFVNSAGILALVGAATGNASAFLPPGGGTLGTGNLSAINVSAGTTSNNMSAVTFSNSNGVSFGLNGSVITASAAASLNLSAGTTSNNLTAFTLSNSNNVSFGLNGSTVTGSAQFNVSGGTTSNNLSAVTFSNSNNVSFGLNGSTMTASAAVNVSAGTTSNNLSAVTFSNSNGVSFGLNGSTLTAMIGGMSSWSNGNPVTALSGGVKTLFFHKPDVARVRVELDHQRLGRYVGFGRFVLAQCRLVFTSVLCIHQHHMDKRRGSFEQHGHQLPADDVLVGRFTRAVSLRVVGLHTKLRLDVVLRTSRAAGHRQRAGRRHVDARTERLLASDRGGTTDKLRDHQHFGLHPNGSHRCATTVHHHAGNVIC